jgi:hypothetical protein
VKLNNTALKYRNKGHRECEKKMVKGKATLPFEVIKDDSKEGKVQAWLKELKYF